MWSHLQNGERAGEDTRRQIADRDMREKFGANRQ
ncbi:hypothetical protein F441_07899 [Phytophthora nicotianae CJ01A1]|uniref:Uncharacterized protein n=5 Tax=Phytophthora nicotianae TaxID=4792 RepID=W2QCE0_PHYN3|nr:hypothetical protein PPTG_22802 [Phytophthora nicotianae INRA-310]ETI47945.1 hypothetical protein F443_07924 [Phytophthora nicotianae P1569]ETK87889.1 hypothetical protein L915_07756 [Phytophthora nicotianae]ETO76679.1 hypothetical protein F444_07972 [Phytophthora nicotianae P1976]ETP17760.1 hypothetical protein F441_07899 [Phytophthora nicotianae CJ01A1]ETL41308.1 hypothetical protein L916_07685 [Phytophthora nicotianae]